MYFRCPFKSANPLITKSPDRQDIPRIGGIFLDFHPQTPDVDIHDLFLPEILLAHTRVRISVRLAALPGLVKK